MLPWIRESCETAEIMIQRLKDEALETEEARERAAQIIHHWAETVAKLGALPKAPFAVDFDSGSDFFCWEYPEQDLFYRHGYDEHERARCRIEETP